MAQQNLLGSDKLNSAYQKINSNFNELYAGGGGGGGGVDNLDELGDVAITLPIGNNQALVYDNVAEKWENQDIPRALSALSDVVIAPLNQGDVLTYSTGASKWVNQSEAYFTTSTDALQIQHSLMLEAFSGVI